MKVDFFHFLAAEGLDPDIEARPLPDVIHNYFTMLFRQVLDEQTVIEPTLEQVQAEALNILNQWRGRKRVEVGLTSTEFQELVYTGKAIEATRWLSDQTSPFGMAGEAAARGITNLEMAQLVAGQHAAWMAASDQIEAAYTTAKAAEAAQSIDEVVMVLVDLLE